MPHSPSEGIPLPTRTVWHRVLHNPWLPAVMGTLCFVSSLGNGYVYDDQALVLNNPRIWRLTAVRQIWLSDWWYPVDQTSPANASRDRLYRPLTLFSFALNRAIGGLHPLGFHLVNVLLHAATCAALWHIARRLTGDTTVASVAAALFAVHPVHVEAVANVVGRAEVLAALFMLVGLLLLCPRNQYQAGASNALRPESGATSSRGAAKPRPATPKRSGALLELPIGGGPSVGRTLLAAGAFLGALLAKETAICYPAIALLALLVMQHGYRLPVRRRLLCGGLLLTPLLIYFPLRYQALEGHLFRAAPAEVLMNPLVTATGLQRVLGAFTVLGHYARLLLMPQQSSPDYGMAVVDPARGLEGMTLAGMLAAVGLIVGLLGVLGTGSTWRRIALLCAMFVASYALISNTLLLIGVSLAERLLYWPSVPALLLAAVGIVEFWRRQCGPGRPLVDSARLLRVLGGLVVAALALLTTLRSLDWANNMALFSAAVAARPEGAYLQRCCAIALLKVWRGDAAPYDSPKAVRAAVERHLQSLNLWRDDWPTNRKRQALLEGAEHDLGAALAVVPWYADALAVRASVRALLGKTELAQRDVEAALEIAPEHADALETRARLVYGADFERRLADLSEQVNTHPDDAALRTGLGGMLFEYGRFPAAQEQLQRAVALDPSNVTAWRRLGEVLAATRQVELAIGALRQVLALAPDDWEAHVNLCQLLAPRDPAAALQHALAANALQPDDRRTIMNLAEAYALNGQTGRALELYRRVQRGLREDDPFRRLVNERIARLGRKQ